MNRPHDRAPLTIEELVGCNGNWRVVYVYHNWGNNILMLLPNNDPDHDSEESTINTSCMETPDGVFEEALMVNQWIGKHPDTPFLVADETMLKCVQVMQDRLAAYNGDWDKFIDDAAEFDKWRKVAHYVATHNGAENTVCYGSWEDLIDKIS